MALTAQVYAQTNDDFFPMAYINERNGSKRIIHSWDFTSITDSGTQDTIPGILWQRKMMKKIQQCPSFKGPSNATADPYTGYNYNASYLGGSAAVLDGTFVTGTLINSSRITEVRKLDKCAIFGDGEFESGANKYMRSPFSGKLDESFWGRYAGTQGYRHNSKTNVAWCDGSAKSVKDCFKNKEPSQIQNIAEGTGFLSNDNSLYDLE